MQKKVVSFFIQKLDEGYVLTEEGKAKAMEDVLNVDKYLTSRFKKEIERFCATGVSNMSIEVSVQENCPTTGNP